MSFPEIFISVHDKGPDLIQPETRPSDVGVLYLDFANLITILELMTKALKDSRSSTLLAFP
jgi:hypothetical protein